MHPHPRRRSSAYLALVVSLAGLLVAAACYAVGLAVVQATPSPDAVLGTVPDLDGAAERDVSQPTRVVAADGSVIGRFRPEELFVPVEAEGLPPNVVTAVIAAEDSSFWHHHGVDVEGIARALLENVREGQIEQGGSTITQQLAKNSSQPAPKVSNARPRRSAWPSNSSAITTSARSSRHTSIPRFSVKALSALQLRVGRTWGSLCMTSHCLRQRSSSP